MRAVRLPTLGSIVFATLFSVTVLTAGVGAAEQNRLSVDHDEVPVLYRAEERSHLADKTTPRDAVRAGPRGRPFLVVLGAIPLVTYAAAIGSRGSELLTPGDRFATSQMIGAGYVVNPRFRFGVVGMFNEALTGLPPAADNWQFGGIAPIAIGTFDHFIIGGGPIVGYRSGGTQQSDLGMVVLTGASVPLRKGLALNIVAPTTALFRRRVTVSLGVAVGVAKVF